MTDILDHLQPDSPLYEATREAAREEIIRLRSINKELAQALELCVAVIENGADDLGAMQAAIAALKKAGIQ